jgi:hypothetical protein
MSVARQEWIDTENREPDPGEFVLAFCDAESSAVIPIASKVFRLIPPLLG